VCEKERVLFSLKEGKAHMYVSEVTVANKNKKNISDFLFLDSIMALKKLKTDIFLFY
jgi:hypothetical protein